MATDLNRLSQRLKQRQPVGVDRSGYISDKDPRNDGSRPSASGNTTLTPKRFFTR